MSMKSDEGPPRQQTAAPESQRGRVEKSELQEEAVIESAVGENTVKDETASDEGARERVAGDPPGNQHVTGSDQTLRDEGLESN